MASCKGSKSTNLVSDDISDIIKLDITYGAFDMVQSNDNIYIADKNKIHIYSTSTGKTAGDINKEFKFCQSLYAGKDSLYAYDSSDDMMFLIDYDSGKVINEYKCPEDIYVHKFIIIKENVIYFDAKKGKINICDLKTKNLKSYAIDKIRAMCLDAYILRSESNAFLFFTIFEDYSAQYIDIAKGKISYDTKEMRYLLELWKKLYEEKLILEESMVFEPFKDNILFSQNI